jgi:hypothetical protein
MQLKHFHTKAGKNLIGNRVARFFLAQTYQNGKNIPDGHKLYQMAVNCSKYKDFVFQGQPKLAQIGIFVLKTNHLATLIEKVSAFQEPESGTGFYPETKLGACPSVIDYMQGDQIMVARWFILKPKNLIRVNFGGP